MRVPASVKNYRNLLLAMCLACAGAAGVYALTSKSGSDNSERSGVVATQPKPTPIASSSQITEGDDANKIHSQPSQAAELLKASQERVAQLETQLKQAPAVGDLDKARKQGDDLRSELGQGAEQLKATQERVGQLEAQLKQAPAAGELDKARKQGEEQSADTTEFVERGDRLLLAADVASARL